MLETNDAFYLEENEAIIRLQAIAAAFDKSKNTKKMITASPLAQGKKFIAKGQNATGYYTTNVPCGLQELHAYIETEETPSRYIESSEEVINDHHSIQYRVIAFPSPVRDRESYASIITKKLDDTIFIISVPCFVKEKVRNGHPDRVRAEIRNMYKLTKISDPSRILRRD